MSKIWAMPEDTELATRSVSYLVNHGLTVEQAADAVVREFELAPEKRAGLLAAV